MNFQSTLESAILRNFLLIAMIGIVGIFIVLRYIKLKNSKYLLLFERLNSLGFVVTGTSIPDSVFRVRTRPRFDSLKSSLTAFGAQSLGFYENATISAQFARIRPEGNVFLFELEVIDRLDDSIGIDYYGFAVFEIPYFLPSISIRPTCSLEKVASSLRADSIQFESEEFNNRFHITSISPKDAHAVIDPQMMEFLMSQPDMDFQIFSHFIMFELSKEAWPLVDHDLGKFVQGFVKKVPRYIQKERAFTSKSLLLEPSEVGHSQYILKLKSKNPLKKSSK